MQEKPCKAGQNYVLHTYVRRTDLACGKGEVGEAAGGGGTENKEAKTRPGATLSLNVSVGGFYCTARFGQQSLIG